MGKRGTRQVKKTTEKKQKVEEEEVVAEGESDKRDYHKIEYWEERYGRDTEAEEKEETNEWCFTYSDLEAILDAWKEKCGAHDDSLVIDLGCGISTMLTEMRQNGWNSNLVGIDFSKNAVEKMNASVAGQVGMERISFVQADLTNLDKLYEPESVDLFVDKMTMDTILHLPGDEGEVKVAKIMAQVASRLKVGGAFVLVTQMDYEANQDFFADTVLSALQECDNHWSVHVHVTDTSAIQVYEFEKLPKHAMSLRGRTKESAVTVKVVSHGGDDSDDSDEDGAAVEK